MKVLIISSVLLDMVLGGSVLGQTVATPTTSTHDTNKCSIDVFDNCTDKFRSLVNVIEDKVIFDKEGLLNFYCGSNFTETVQCLHDHLDPTCGPDTAAYTIKRTLAVIPPDFSYDKLCRNDSRKEYNDLLTCQTLLPNIQGYADCITGETLNKTFDPADICSVLNSTLGCSYKYTNIMCPNSINAFIESAANAVVGNCNVDFENTQEAMSCDDGIEKACSVAYKPPPHNSTAAEFVDFICSERARGMQQCLHKVFAMCKEKSGYNVSSISTYIKHYETQTAMFCSNNKENNELKKCQALFPKVNAFQDCITGKTLNKTVDPTDFCSFLQNSIGCTYKYTNLMCPKMLDAFNKSVDISSNCQLNMEMSKAVATCDNNMDQACSVAYNPPVTNDPEMYVEFICSGRAKGYTTCVQKVHKLCDSANTDVSSVLHYSQSGDNQTEIICTDKTSYKSFARCLTSYSASEEYSNCTSTVDINDKCSVHTCSLSSINKMCPSSAEFYKRLFYSALTACNIIIPATNTGTADIPVMTSSTAVIISVVVIVRTAFIRYF